MASRSAIVANAGNHPEPMYVAAGLIAHGWRCTYLTATMWAPDSLMMRLARFPAWRGWRLASSVRRRALPGGLHARHVHSLARVREYYALAVRKLVPGRSRAANEARTSAFARAAARHASRARNKPELVIGQYNSSLRIFRACPESFRVLMYPIAHHEWMRLHLGAEAAKNPRWAAHLQGADTAPDRSVEMDREIDLADLVIVPSSFTRDTFIEVGVPPEKVVTVSLGVDLQLADFVGQRSSRSSGPLQVLFAGQVNQRKGIGYLLEAVRRFDQDTLLLSIAGPATEEMRRLIAHEYPDVRMHGTMSRAELLAHMADADVLVLPSLAEGFGLVALEAMAVGTPAILTPRTFGTDIVQNGVNGWITPVADSAALSELLVQIGQNRDALAQVSDRALETARNCGWERYSDEIHDLIVQAMSNESMSHAD